MARIGRSTAALAVVGCVVAGCSSGPGEHRAVSPTAEQSDQASMAPKLTATSIATGLHTPWGIAFLPDGTALVTDRDDGTIHAVSPQHKVTQVGTVPGVVKGAEAGLLGIAVSPDYSHDHHIYVYYSAAHDNRVAELTYRAGKLTGLHDLLTGIPRGTFHNGGALAFGPDRLLYVGTGDATNHPAAQRLNYLGGKVLRITPDGKAAPGNPFPAHPLIYSYGHRNIEGLAFDRSGRLWESEFGENTWDELNLIRKGGNYGWPTVEGPSHNAKFVSPLRVWHTPDASPSGLAVWQGSAWLASLRGERLWQVPLNGADTGTPKARYAGTYGRLRAAVAAPDGSLWITTSNTDGRGTPHHGDDRILRITPAG